MSILIKDMKMPTSCYDCNCFIRDSDGSDYCCLLMQDIEDNDKRDDNCPLVPVPPHGDLIDRDALDDAFTDLRWENGDYKSGALMHWGDRPHWCLVGGEVENLINAAPTIIPEDVPENNVGNIPAEESE